MSLSSRVLILFSWPLTIIFKRFISSCTLVNMSASTPTVKSAFVKEVGFDWRVSVRAVGGAGFASSFELF